MNEKAWVGYADNRYAEQRKAGFPWLRFDRELEAEYRESFVEANAFRIRVAAYVGLLAVVGFIVLDRVFGAHLEPALGEVSLIGFTVPACIVPLVATYMASARPLLMRLIQLGVAGVSVGVLGAVMFGRMANPAFPYESLLLVAVYTFFVSGLMFYQAVVASALVWVAFIATNWSLQSHDRLLYEGYYLFVCNSLGWLGLYLLDRQARMEFLLRRELHQQAVLDPLTGLMNRRAFKAHLESAWLQSQRALTSVGVMLIDIDRFKRINDSCGHQFGDNALIHVARVLRASAMRPLDAAARYGGDEFVAIWYDVDGAWLQRLAEEFPKRLAGLSCGEKADPIPVTVSGGIVLAWPRPGMQAAETIKAADEMLYETKRAATGTIGYKVLRPAFPQSDRTAA